MTFIINIKTILLIVGLLLAESYTLLAQTYKATYLITFQADSTNISSKRQERGYLFMVNNESSYYATENFYKKDSLLRLVNSGKVSAYEIMGDKSNLFVTKFNQFIQKTSQKKITVYDNINIDTYRYDIISALSWSILDVTAVINNYDCMKATTHFAGRDYVAWFTKDIPIPDGPYVFCGLPGLIVKINDLQSYYTFELIGFESYAEDVVSTLAEDPEKIISTNRSEVFRIREEQRLNPIGSFDRSFGGSSILSAEQRQLMKKKIAANNNPLELSID